MTIREARKCKTTGIYKITNLISGHCYIGQSKNIGSRMRSHLSSTYNPNRSDYDYPIHVAIRKYGEENFNVEILAICSYQELNKLEHEFVTKFNSKVDGYNQTRGGYQSIRLIKLTEDGVAEIKRLLKESYLTYKEIATMYNVNIDSIKRINDGRMWCTKNDVYPIRPTKLTELIKSYTGTYVCQYNKLTNNIINEYTSTLSAEKFLNIPGAKNHILGCIQGKRKTAYGYIWKRVSISLENYIQLFYKGV